MLSSSLQATLLHYLKGDAPSQSYLVDLLTNIWPDTATDASLIWDKSDELLQHEGVPVTIVDAQGTNTLGRIRGTLNAAGSTSSRSAQLFGCSPSVAFR